jgi:hypothetical protein
MRQQSSAQLELLALATTAQKAVDADERRLAAPAYALSGIPNTKPSRCRTTNASSRTPTDFTARATEPTLS